MRFINPAQSMYAGACPNPGTHSSNLCAEGYVWSPQLGKCIPGSSVQPIFAAMGQQAQVGRAGGTGVVHRRVVAQNPAFRAAASLPTSAPGSYGTVQPGPQMGCGPGQHVCGSSAPGDPPICCPNYGSPFVSPTQIIRNWP